MINYVLLSCSVWIPPPFLLSIESNPLGTFAFYFLPGDFSLWGWMGDVGGEEIVCFAYSNIQTCLGYFSLEISPFFPSADKLGTEIFSSEMPV